MAYVVSAVVVIGAVVAGIMLYFKRMRGKAPKTRSTGHASGHKAAINDSRTTSVYENFDPAELREEDRRAGSVVYDEIDSKTDGVMY